MRRRLLELLVDLRTVAGIAFSVGGLAALAFYLVNGGSP